jgi:hypothetical protein
VLLEQVVVVYLEVKEEPEEQKAFQAQLLEMVVEV